jgi:hypothetical protein
MRPELPVRAAFPPITAAPVRQLPAGSAEPTAAEAIAALGWTLTQASGGDRCQVIEAGQRCAAGSRRPIGPTTWGDAWICTPHNEQLCRVINGKAVLPPQTPAPEPVPAFIRRMTGMR